MVRWSNYFTEDIHAPKATGIFFKALVVYTLLKMVILWPIASRVASYHAISLPRSIVGKVFMAPSFFAEQHFDIFYGVAIGFLIMVFFTKRYYATSILFFWLTFNLYAINLPLSNGSDVVLFMLSMWCIPLSRFPVLETGRWNVIQKVIYNLGLIFCQLQIASIYVASGFDKLLSETWRSGDAFAYIQHLELLYNPVLPAFFQSKFWNIVFSWSTILFELLFVVLVWNKKMRLPVLLIGTIFHLFIWAVLSLPDFALIMIVSYLVFLRDEDYEWVRGWIRGWAMF